MVRGGAEPRSRKENFEEKRNTRLDNEGARPQEGGLSITRPWVAVLAFSGSVKIFFKSEVSFKKFCRQSSFQDFTARILTCL